MLKIFAVILGLVLILMVLWETFETIVLPRRVTRQFRLTRFFYRINMAALDVAGCSAQQQEEARFPA